jgi:hypothetical protein
LIRRKHLISHLQIFFRKLSGIFQPPAYLLFRIPDPGRSYHAAGFFFLQNPQPIFIELILTGNISFQLLSTIKSSGSASG